MVVAFHTNQICLQGTEIALFDYAHFNEEFLGNKSIVISKQNKISVKGGAGLNQPLALEKFKQRFPLFLYRDFSEVESILKRESADCFYAIKKGVVDGVESKVSKTLIHTVFKYYEPHGQVYAYISKWLTDKMTGGRSPFVPHMIHLPRVAGDLREELKIPKDAIVFGRYGGTNSFDVEFVPKVMLDFIEENKNVFFLFMNTDDFLNPKRSMLERIWSPKPKLSHPRIKFLSGTSSMDYKSKFINTCQAMIHARKRGETFGIAVGEFSINNVPVITYAGSGEFDFESNHIEILGKKAFLYNNSQELMSIFRDFVKNHQHIGKQNWDAYSEEYGPRPVMEKFKRVFLDS